MGALVAFELYMLALGFYYAGNKPLVHLTHGTIRGEKTVDENGNDYFAFRGIPYAEPPIEDLRFKAPVPKHPWDGILNTVVDGPPCPQIFFFTNKYIGTENNCLTLNVYTPAIPRNKSAKYDVVFHIHGGGFAAGDGGENFLYGSKRFMQKSRNVILVSVTYRVGPLGFLSTMDTSSPGNYGLLDQVEALRWVHNNIDKFGGDPSKITLFGESAGSASVLYHVLSPVSKGLFQKAIAMSGTPLAPWAHQHEPLYHTKHLAQKLGCAETSNTKNLINCLKEKTAEEIIRSNYNDESLLKLHNLIFSPTVDHYFLPDTPYNIIKNKQYNDVPLVMGVTKDEGNCWFRLIFPKIHEEFTDEEIDVLIQTIFNGITNKNEAVRKVKERYFTSSRKSEDVHNSFSQLITDAFFHKYHYQTVKMLAERGSKIYLYSYDYSGNMEPFTQLFNASASTKLGACHAFDLTNFFTNQIFGNASLKGTDLTVKEHMQKLFFNFIHNSDPNSADVEVKWLPTKPDQFNVYHIDEQNTVGTYDEKHDEFYQFWVEEIPKIFEHIHEHSPNFTHNSENV